MIILKIVVFPAPLGPNNPKIEFAATSIVEAVEWMHTVDQRLASLMASLKDRSRARGDSVASRVIQDLPVDADTVAVRYGVTRQAAHEALTRLSEDGVLGARSFSRRTKAGRPRRMFSSLELVNLLNEIVTG